MKTVKILIAVSLLFLVLYSCKKEGEAKAYYYGKWNVTSQEYTSIDTSYTESVAIGTHTYDFNSNNTVDIITPGMVNTSDYWALKEGDPDSIEFGNIPSWEILQSNNTMFKAKFYMNSNAHMTFTLER